jgi:acyl carrier protein
MPSEQTAERARKIIADILSIDVSSLSDSSDITSFESWDSMAQVRIIAELEDALECSIPIEKIKLLKKVEDFLNVIG